MKLVGSNSPEVARIVSTGALASWGSAVGPACVASAVGLFVALALRLIFSVGAGVWIGVPVLVLLNVFMLWRSRSPRLNWVVAACADRLYVRLFAARGRIHGNEPEIMVLEASEIPSISARTIDVFLYGPKPRNLHWLVIEPAQVVTEVVSDRIHGLQSGISPNLCGMAPVGPHKQVFVGNDHGPLTIEWKWCRPALSSFLHQIAQKCPSIVIAPEQRSELDLNGIWHGYRSEPKPEQRRLLAQAMRLGFVVKCKWLLIRYKFMTYQEAAAYLAEIQQEEHRTGISTQVAVSVRSKPC